MNAKPKLPNSSSLLESEDESGDEQIVFAHQRNIHKGEYNCTDKVDDDQCALALGGYLRIFMVFFRCLYN